jgi:hypothetical protein
MNFQSRKLHQARNQDSPIKSQAPSQSRQPVEKSDCSGTDSDQEVQRSPSGKAIQTKAPKDLMSQLEGRRFQGEGQRFQGEGRRFQGEGRRFQGEGRRFQGPHVSTHEYPTRPTEHDKAREEEHDEHLQKYKDFLPKMEKSHIVALIMNLVDPKTAADDQGRAISNIFQAIDAFFKLLKPKVRSRYP